MTKEAATPASEQETQAAPNLVTLKDYAQELVKAAELAEGATDVITKEYDLGELEQHLEAFQKLIDKARDGLKDEKKQEILAALLEVANEFEFDSVEAMLDAAGLAPKATIKIQNSASSDNLAPKKRPSVDKTPKVFAHLLKEEHNGGKIDFKKGHNGVLKGKNPGWHYKTLDKKPDPKYFREADDTETKKMEAARDAYKKKHPNA